MTLAQIIEALPPQVYLRPGELVIHFSGPSDLVNRVAETSAALADLETPRTDGKAPCWPPGHGSALGCRRWPFRR